MLQNRAEATLPRQKCVCHTEQWILLKEKADLEVFTTMGKLWLLSLVFWSFWKIGKTMEQNKSTLWPLTADCLYISIGLSCTNASISYFTILCFLMPGHQNRHTECLFLKRYLHSTQLFSHKFKCFLQFWISIYYVTKWLPKFHVIWLCTEDWKVWHLCSANPLPEPMLSYHYYQLDPFVQTSVKFKSKYKTVIQDDAFENNICKM